MGTTASVLVLSDSGYLIGQVGDSRVYLLRDGALRQLTKDHSYVQEQVDAGYLTPEQARYHPYSNVITRCVGANDSVEPDVFVGPVLPGDVFLVASDGLTGMVDDRRLQQLLSSGAAPRRVVDALIAEANGRGGLDNITAILVQVHAVGSAQEPPPPPAMAPIGRGRGAPPWPIRRRLTRRSPRWRTCISGTSCTRSRWRPSPSTSRGGARTPPSTAGSHASWPRRGGATRRAS